MPGPRPQGAKTRLTLAIADGATLLSASSSMAARVRAASEAADDACVQAIQHINGTRCVFHHLFRRSGRITRRRWSNLGSFPDILAIEYLRSIANGLGRPHGVTFEMPTSRHCLLIVDDEPDVCDSVQDLLRREFRVLKAHSAEEGYRLMQG